MVEPQVEGRDWGQIGRELRAARVLAGLDQREAAAQLGVNERTIRKIEQGRGAKVLSGTVAAYARLVGHTLAASLPSD